MVKRLVLALVLATVAACSSAGVTGVDQAAQCPDSDKQLSRAEWRACFGYQDHDASSSGS